MGVSRELEREREMYVTEKKKTFCFTSAPSSVAIVIELFNFWPKKKSEN